MVGILLLIAVVNSLLLIPLAIATILFGLVLKLYMRTAQDLKRLEGISKSLFVENKDVKNLIKKKSHK